MKAQVFGWSGSEAPNESRCRAELESDGFEVVRWSDAAATRYEPHHHDHDETLWLCSGEMTFGIAGDQLRLLSGDRLVLPRGTVHSAVAGESGATYLVGRRRRPESSAS